MEGYPKVILKPGKEAPLLRFHPWVFSGAIRRTDGALADGDIVEVWSAGGKYLATGHFQEDSIAVKVFSFQQTPAGQEFWNAIIRQAFDLRKRLGLADNPSTTGYRLVNSEGDSLPGLIIDWYNGVCVIQSHSTGMHRIKPLLVIALQEIYGDKLVAVYDKSGETMTSHPSPPPLQGEEVGGRGPSDTEGTGVRGFDGFLLGAPNPVEITETGHRFRVDIEKGQKTGFFLDQRANRMFAQYYARDRKVLNAFCYSGAFSVYALKGGASSVHSVDSSRQAIEWTKENIRLNGIEDGLHTEIQTDVKQFLPSSAERYDLIILDPPAFAKHRNVSHNALQAYIHINSEALKKLNPGGILFTFSCSQAVSGEMFRGALQAAAIEAGREARVLHRLSQGPDHPVHVCHPEGEYLKGFILGV
jgi:23S rRNA (cytosine1962-C5)-methyltransferase